MVYDLNLSVRDELIRMNARSPAAELAGLISGSRRHCDGSYVIITLTRLLAARRMMLLQRSLDECNSDTAVTRTVLELDKRSKKARFIVCLDDQDVLDAECQRMSFEQPSDWLRGLWCAAGALYLPQNGYYMYIRTANGSIAARAADVLRELDCSPVLRERNGAVEISLRDQQEIAACMTSIGAVKTSLKLEETALLRSLKSKANKLVNCDNANIGKTVAAASSQLAIVKIIEDASMWDELPFDLAEIARLRREEPSASLRELGAMTKDRVSKSTVEYRWKKLEKLLTQKGMVCHVLGKS